MYEVPRYSSACTLVTQSSGSLNSSYSAWNMPHLLIIPKAYFFTCQYLLAHYLLGLYYFCVIWPGQLYVHDEVTPTGRQRPCDLQVSAFAKNYWHDSYSAWLGLEVATSWIAHLEKFSVNFSSSSFVVRVSTHGAFEKVSSGVLILHKGRAFSLKDKITSL